MKNHNSGDNIFYYKIYYYYPQCEIQEEHLGDFELGIDIEKK